MLEIKILISELDYDGVMELAAPLAAEKLAQKGGLMGRLAGSSVGGLKKLIYNKYLAGKTQDQRDQLAAELVARNQGFLMEKAAELAKKNGVNVQVKDISVRKI